MKMRNMNLENLVLRCCKVMPLYLQEFDFVVLAHAFCYVQYPSILSWCLDDAPWTHENHHGFKNPIKQHKYVQRFDSTSPILILMSQLLFYFGSLHKVVVTENISLTLCISFTIKCGWAYGVVVWISHFGSWMQGSRCFMWVKTPQVLQRHVYMEKVVSIKCIN
jgi:hypothetical protein